ncbi:MAG: FKBP-type peptidyl-prolyl cis-trans isomerase [Mucilaginibacter sp.]|uniref:FKBP-type peptidyl-prolyl cis-trans isomerase n=1 Tax=Mucilaginibacter sp. TaxID=1882438 RepID=UPI00319FAF75
MKQKIFTLLLITSIGLLSCRKTNNDPNIKQYDDIQIQNYIKANGLTGMKRDTSHGDTSGIYYEILSQGSTAGIKPLDYSDSVAFVLSVKTFDGKFVNQDTLNLAHFDGLVGYISLGSSIMGFTKGLQSAIHDVIKYPGTRARILVPSRVCYGVNGAGSGSSSNVNNRIAGNQCIDYYVNVITSIPKYQDYLIKEYMQKNGLTGFTQVTSGRGAGMYYKITTPGSGVGDVYDHNLSSSFVGTYTGKYLNGALFGSTATDPETAGTTTLTTFDPTQGDLVAGVQEGLKGLTSGAAITMLLPSRLGYGKIGSPPIGPDACLRFDFVMGTITNP